MVQRWIKPIVAVALLAIAVWQVDLLLDVLHVGQESSHTAAATVKSGEFVVGITREGAIESANVVSLRAPRSGSIITWIIEDGAEVEEGDLIAQLDTKDYRFQVEQQRLSYENKVAEVDQERRDRTRDHESALLSVDQYLRGMGLLEETHTTEREQSGAQVSYDTWNVNWSEQYFEKQSRLFDGGIVPETQVEQSERELRSREHALGKSEKGAEYLGAEQASEKAQSRSDIETAQFEAELSERRIGEAVASAEDRARMAAEQLDEMSKQLAEGEIRAPSAGIVLIGMTWGRGNRRKFEAGDRVRSRQPIADITQLTELKANLRVEEDSISQVELGQKVVISVKTAPDRHFEGEVSAIGAVAREVSPREDPRAVPGQRIFDVTVRIPDADVVVLRPGIDAEVQFVVERIPDAIYVPLQAVFRKPGGQFVYVQGPDGFVPREVKTGKHNEDAVVILEGLESGEKVTLRDPTRVETN